jgi:hypothetical protein
VTHHRIGISALLALAIVGCGSSGDNLPRQSVSGTITLDGKSLERGMISFQPVSELPTAIAVPISGGEYYIEKGQGLVPGSYKVKISSTPPPVPEPLTAEGTPPPPGKPTPPPKDLMPERYNSSTILIREVKGGVSNTFDFPLESRPPKK